MNGINMVEPNDLGHQHKLNVLRKKMGLPEGESYQEVFEAHRQAIIEYCKEYKEVEIRLHDIAKTICAKFSAPEIQQDDGCVNSCQEVALLRKQIKEAESYFMNGINEEGLEENNG